MSAIDRKRAADAHLRSAPRMLTTAGVLASAGCEDGIVPPMDPPAVASVVVTPASADLVSGDTLTLEAIVTDSAGNVLEDRAVEWTTSDPIALTVSDGGLVTAKVLSNERDAMVMATAEGVSGGAVSSPKLDAGMSRSTSRPSLSACST